MYIHQLHTWPTFSWELETITDLLATVRYKQGQLVGRMKGMGFQLQSEASLNTITLDVLKTSEIEGEILDGDQVRSSIARKLRMNIAGLVPADHDVDGVVEMMLDATQQYKGLLKSERLFNWHNSLFPTNKYTKPSIIVGRWRENSNDDPMQVVSGPLGREKVHFQAPNAERVPSEMESFIKWFNRELSMDPVMKAAIAHLWFVTIHPFDDGNGRIARAITDMQLTRSDASTQRFYSMSAQIRTERKAYYDMLEKTQKGSLNITQWIKWFLECLGRSIDNTDENLSSVLRKSRFWEKHATTSFNERQKKILNKLFDGFEGNLTSSKWARMTKSSQDSAGRDINDLIMKGVLIKESGGGRSTSYALLTS